MENIGLTIALANALAKGPTDTQVTDAVDAWLDDHPEATTTVEDGAVTKAKLNSSLQGTVDDVADMKNEFVGSDYFDMATLGWEDGTLDNSGAEVADPGVNKRWRTDFIPVNRLTDVILSIPRYCFLYGYKYDKNKAFLGYVSGGWQGATSEDQNGIVKITRGSECFYRFVLKALNGYSSSERAITAADRASTYIFYEKQLRQASKTVTNIAFVSGGIVDYFNMTDTTNANRANTFFIPTAGRHMILDVPSGYQIYTWQFDKDYSYLRERGWSTGKMYYYLNDGCKFIRMVAKTDAGDNAPSADALKAVNVTFLETVEKTPVNPILRENCLLAHRGYASVAPENTIQAIELAAENGYKQVEIDLQFSSDGVCVLLHDNTIDRTSDGTGNVYEKTYSQLLEYDFGSWKSATYAGTKIPTLKEALLCCKFHGMCAQLDIADTTKTNITAANLQTMIDVIMETGMASNVSICAEDDRARKIIALKQGLIMCVGVGDTEGKFNARKDLADGSSMLIGSNSTETATDTTMERCHNAGMPYQIWTIDTASTAITKFKAGYDWIITNNLKPTDIS